MALVIGHSQTKYLSDYLSLEDYCVFSYPGYRTFQFSEEEDIFEVAPYFSVIILVVGANDIGSYSPQQIARNIEHLCQEIHAASPSATICLSEILPRAQNLFPESQLSHHFLDQWNYDAALTNRLLDNLSNRLSWLNVIDQRDFHTMFGANRQLLSRDGLHLSFDGTETLTSNIENAVFRAKQLHQPSTISHPPRSIMNQMTISHPPRSVMNQMTISHPPRSVMNQMTISHPPRSVMNQMTISHPPRSVMNQMTKPHPPKIVKNQALHHPIKDLPSAPIHGRSSTRNKRTSSKQSPSVVVRSVQPRLKTQYTANRSIQTSSVRLIETKDRYFLRSDTIVLEGGGSESETPMFTKSDRTITYQEAADILIQNLPDSITKKTPYRPSEGSLFVFDDSDSSKDDWRADGYTWRNYGKRVNTSEDKNIEKLFFKISNKGVVNSNFQKHVYRFTGDDYNGRTVILYFGDCTEYKGMPHGNRKRNLREHKRTKPSVLKNIRENGLSDHPKQVHDIMVSEASPSAQIKGVSVPRNQRQIKNHQSKERRDKKLTHDSLYSLHLLVQQLGDYIISIKTTPDLEVIIGNAEIFQEVNKLLQLKDVHLELFYDTTFNLGDFYVSTMAIQHPMFKEKPIIPIAFMLHERKFQSCHEHFIEEIKKKIPKISEKNINVVTDREKGIINAFETKLSNAQVLICWNHILNDIKFWVTKHGGKYEDKKVYEMNVRDLLQCENLETFNIKLNQMKDKWSEAFVTYFEDNLFNTITQYAARWILEEKDVYNPYSGITNNVSESLNAKLKRLIDYKEKAIDEIVLYLFYLQGNDLSALIRAFCGESEWSLMKHFKFASLDADSVIFPKNVCHPDKLVQLIKGELKSLVKEDDKETDEQTETTDEFKPTIKIENKSKDNSQKALAIQIIAENDIILVPQMGAFMVKGQRGDKYSVTLFPNEKCSCPSTSRCYHIIAAMMAIGMKLPDDKKVYNLAQLRRNCRPKQLKKCGTKKGRIGDNDQDININAAPDSVLKTVNSSVIMTPITCENKKYSNTPISKVKKSLFSTSTPKSILKSENVTPKSSKQKRKLIFKEKEQNKKLKLENSLSVIFEDNDIIELQQSRNDESYECNIQQWQPELGLMYA